MAACFTQHQWDESKREGEQEREQEREREREVIAFYNLILEVASITNDIH